MKVLIIQTAFMGDVILTLPLVDCLKGKSGIESVDYLTRPDGYNVLETNPNIDSIIVYDKHGKDKGILNVLRMVKILRKKKYDAVYIPHRSFRSGVMALLAGIKERTGFDKSAASFLYTKKIEYKNTIHEIERNLSLLSPEMGECTGKQPVIHFNDTDNEVVESFFQKHSITENAVGIAPGSAWETKRWLKERFAELIIRLKKQSEYMPILLGGVNDKVLCDEIHSLSNFAGINAAGIFTPRQSALAMSKTKVVVTNDSGAAHLGVGGKARVITIYGPTVPGFGFYPYGEGHIIVEKNLPCRPCGIHGGEECPEKHFKCMKEITPEDVLNEIKKIIQLTPFL